MFFFFKKFGASYNPLIDYKWNTVAVVDTSTSTQTANEVYSKNSGTLKQNSKLFSGNPLDFQGSQSIDITLPNFANMYLYEVVNGVSQSQNLVGLSGATYSIGKVDGTGAFIDSQFDYTIIVENALTPAQITKQFQYPNQFFKDMVDDPNTLFATDFRGDNRYIADSVNYSEGANVISFALSNWTISNDSGASSVTEDVNGNIVIDYVNTDSVYLNILQSVPKINVTWKATIVVDSLVGGSLKVQDGDTNTSFGIITSAGTYTFISTSNLPNVVIARQDLGTSVYAVVSEFTLVELTGVHAIQGYSSTQRTNFANEPTGLQDIRRSFSDVGFFLDNVVYCNTNRNGRGYEDTGWVAPNNINFAVEAHLLWEDLLSSTSYIGSYDVGTNRFTFGKGSGYKAMYLAIGTGVSGVATIGNAVAEGNNILIVVDYLTSTAKVWNNGVYIGERVYVFDGCISPFCIPSRGLGTWSPTQNMIATKFKVHTDTTKALEDYLKQFA